MYGMCGTCALREIVEFSKLPNNSGNISNDYKQLENRPRLEIFNVSVRWNAFTELQTTRKP